MVDEGSSEDGQREGGLELGTLVDILVG